jgi:hypothetical protein
VYRHRVGRAVLTALGLALCAAGAACFSPSPAAGLPCSDGEPRCPSGQTCNDNAPGGPTCELPGTIGADGPPGGPDAAFGTPDAPVGTPDAPATAGPINDEPGGAIDVGAGGDFVLDTTGAHDDFAGACTGTGGLDLFYTLTISDEEVVYIDMIGTDFDGVLAIRHGDCTPIGTGVDCQDDPCSNGQPLGAWDLTPGTYCLIVDQGGVETETHGELHVRRTGHAGIAFPDTAGQVAGDTCDGTSGYDPACGCSAAPELWYFLTVCPGVSTTIHADVCTTSMYDAVEDILDIDGDSLACDDDSPCGDASVSAGVDTPGLYWVIQDGCSACGAYTMNYSY